jgi:protein-arginine kinase activator protein McsA
MICGNCGNQNARIWKIGGSGKEKWEMCEQCGASSRGVPDVYFKGAYLDENISSEQYPGAKFITSRQEKKMWLNKCNLREAGDRYHGATSFDRISNRHAMKSLERSK